MKISRGSCAGELKELVGANPIYDLVASFAEDMLLQEIHALFVAVQS